jgi:hypothetical protein
LEKRLGRRLQPADFTAAKINPDPWDTPRLAARKAGFSRRTFSLRRQTQATSTGTEDHCTLIAADARR